MTTSDDLTFLWNAERKGQIKVSYPPHLVKIFGSKSIVMTNGAAHRSLRRLFEPAFAPLSVRGYVNIMDETIQEFLKDLHDQQHQGDGLLSSTAFKYFALKIFCVAAFGKDLPDSTIRKLAAELKNVLDGTQSVFPFAIPGTQFHTAMQSRRKSIEMIQTLITNFKDKYDENSPQATQTLLGRLCYGPSSRDGEPLSNEELSENLCMIMIAGHDTTYSSIGSLFHYISSNPEIFQALEQEVQEFLLKKQQGPDDNNKNANTTLDYTALKDELPILNAVIAEVWRIMPPVPFGPRKMGETLPHKKYTFHKGTTMYFNIILGCQDEDRYPDPQEFRIERFLSPNHPFLVERKKASGKEEEENENDYYKGIEYTQKRQCYPVFGGGNHSCLGWHFARLELRILLLRLLERYSLDVKRACHVPFPVQRWECDFTLQKKAMHAN